MDHGWRSATPYLQNIQFIGKEDSKSLESIPHRTTSHHKHKAIDTFPRHIHIETEKNVVDDNITHLSNTPAENLRNLLRWVETQLEMD